MSLLILPVFWLLVGSWALTFLDLTAATTHGLQITQKPRFYSVTTNKEVRIYCSSSQQLLDNVTWHKADKFNSKKKSVIQTKNSNLTKNDILILKPLRMEDQGVYFCEIKGVYGPGTEVQVAKPVNQANVLYQSQMKDALMVLQGLLLALVIAAFGYRKRTLSAKQDTIYEEPEVDHIYEGLALDACEEGDLYEEISAYAVAEGTEAPWE